MHYIYAVFERMTRTAEPFMRPMWHEFPDQPATYDINTQYMIGKGILFAPKVTRPTTIMSSIEKQEINFYLPEGEKWYNYQTKLEETQTGVWQNRLLSDLEQGIFVLGYTILPVLQHEDCMAILGCIENPITLEVYSDSDNDAYGELYLDDGETFDFANDSAKSALISFNFDGTTLSSAFEHGSDYELPASQQVTAVVIYGVETAPVLVLAANLEANFLYDADKKALYTSGFSMKLGQGKMIELAWN